MMYDGAEMSGAMWLGMALWGLLVLSLIALAVAGTLRLLRRSGSDRPSPREELDARYARGQLEREDYLQRRSDLAEDR